VITVVGVVLVSAVDYLDDLLAKRRCAGWTFRSRPLKAGERLADQPFDPSWVQGT